MPSLNLGNSETSMYYLGSDPVSYIYFGSTLIWPTLPEIAYFDYGVTSSMVSGGATNYVISNISPYADLARYNTANLTYGFTGSDFSGPIGIHTASVIPPSTRYGSYTQFSNPTSFRDIVSSSLSFTFEIWIKPYQKNATTNVYLTGPQTSPVFSMYTYWFFGISNIDTNDGSMVFMQNMGLSNTSSLVSASTAPNVVDFGQWNHLVYTFTRNLAANTTSFAMYKNGVQQTITKNNYTSGVLPSAGRLLFLSNGWTNKNIFGFYDVSQFRLYTKALTPTQVNTRYQETKARYTPPALTSMKIIASEVPINLAGIEYTINDCFNGAGVTAPTLSSSGLYDNTYTGADLDPNTYQVVYIANNGAGIGSSALANNLKAYMDAGGAVVFAPYVGGGDTYNPGGSSFDAALLPYTNKSAGVVNDLNPKTLRVDNSSHPIVTAAGVSTGDFLGQSNLYIGFQSSELRPEASVICSQTYDSVNYIPWVIAYTYAGVSRCVYHNFYAPQAQNPIPTVTKKLLVHSLRWAAGVI